jgi:serine phosphatase RsbU (regulator of sigma subunit)
MIRIERLYDSLVTSAAVADGHPRLAARAADLAAPQAPIDIETTNDQVLAHLRDHPEVEALAVVQGGVPVGLINRNIFMEAYVKPFAREVYGRRSCIAWMDKEPLLADAALPLETLVHQAVAIGAKALKDGFLVTEGGRYAGLGTGYALLKAIAAVEAEKTRRLLDSIEYASTIQRAYLRTSAEQLAAAVADQAMVWEPRDVVGGDCYFFRRLPGGTFLALLDCTGHGVPGAFMTLIALSWLGQAFQGAEPPRDPAAALAGLNGYVKRVLGQTPDEMGPDGQAPRSDDGLDAACLWLPDGAGHAEFAGAHLPLLLVRPGGEEPEVVDGDRTSVGYVDTPADQRWTTRRVAVPPGTLLALATDGVIDQPGGPRRLAHGRRRLAQLLGEHRAEPAAPLAARFREAFAAWQGAELRRDDVTLLLLRPGAPA